MHTDHAVLKALGGQYSPERLASVLNRVLRVPEAWAALHNPGFLAEVSASHPLPQLTPSHLAALALGGDLAKPIQTELAEPHLERAELAWQEADLRARGTRDLFETALLGLEFLRRHTSAMDPDLLIRRAVESPHVWGSPLALIWPALPDPELTLAHLIEADGEEIAVQIALSNLPAEEAGSYLLRNANGSTVRLMQEINRIAEQPLAHSVGLAKNGIPAGRDRLSQLLVQAMSELSAGEHEAACDPLRQAWHMATRTAAQIAELTALQARLAQDPVTEFEANRQALSLEPTPARRAWTALSLSKLGRLGEALSMISGERPAIEEQIASGVILTAEGQSGRAALQAALAAIDTRTRLDDAWFEFLTDGLWAAGERVLAVEAASKRIERLPASSSARTRLAQLLFESGDSEASAEQAQMAQALSPASHSAGELLAKSLQDLGRYPEALELWKGLQASGAEHLEALAECAIRAGELELASGAAGELRKRDSNSQAARLIEGRILAGKGEPAAGRLKLEEALELAPERAEPHLALAALHDKSGDQRQVGETLARAAQTNPGNAAIRAALAEWLKSQGRSSEAFEAAARALELDPGNLEVVLVHADLLRGLGHTEQAIANLRSAALLKPRSWRIGLALAQALEARGEHEEAASLAAAIPKSAPPESLLTAAQIGVRTGINPEGAIEALTRAEELGLSSAELDYWFGKALEASGQFDLAMKRFEQALLRLPVEQVELREAATLGIARSALGTAQISLALSSLEEALQWFRGTTDILTLMSLVYQSANLPEKAVEVARQAVEANNEAAGAWTALGKALAGSGDFQGALKAFARTSELEPSNVSGWLELADIATQKGESSIARRAVAEAAWRGRRRPEVLVKAAGLLSARGSYTTAQRLLRAGMRRRPKDASLRREFANLTEQAGDLQAALRAWMNCVEIEPFEPEPLRRAAAVAAQIGELERSIEFLERAVGLAPRNGKVRRELAGAYLRLGRVRPGLAAYEAASKELGNDPALPLEAADASLLAGAIEEALQWIAIAHQVAADPGLIQAAQGEAYLARNQWQEAETALAAAIASGNMSPRVLAMVSIIASRTNLSAAEEALDRATQTPCESSHDAIWLGRAHLRMLNWEAALRTLELWRSDAFGGRELARVSLRILGAHWLFHKAGALMAAPQMDGQSLISSVESTLQGLRHQGLTEAADSLHQALEVARDPARAASLVEHVKNDATGMVGEFMAIAQLRAGQVDQVLETIALVQQVCPNPEWASLLEGLSQTIAGNPSYARTAYRRALQDPILSPLGSFLLGQAYAAANRPELAASHLNAAVTAWPEEHVWQRALGMHYAEAGEPDSALVHIQQALASAPENPIYRLDLARLYRQSGQLSQAEEAYSQATVVNPDSSESFREAAETALEIGKIEKAAQWFERASAIEPSDHRNLIGAAVAASERGDRQRAGELLAAAIQMAPDSAEVMMGQGRIEARAGQVEAAMRTFERALSAGAPRSQVRRAQSKLLLEHGQAGRAIPALLQTLEADPNEHGLWHELALAREATSDWHGADEAVSEAVRIAPLNSEYRLTAGRIARRSGQLDRALDELRGAADLAPVDARVCIETGIVYEQRREFSRALEWYRKAITIDPDRLEAFYRAGVLLRTMKAYRKAGEMLKRAAELAPVNQDVLHQLAAVRALELVHG